jgi:tRNA (cmo5U34)-methyltransferase
MTGFLFRDYAEFDEHFEKSIRGYSDLRNDIVSISKCFIDHSSVVLDIGCSQGTMLKRIKDANTQVHNAKYIGLDIEPSFKKHWVEERNLTYQVCAVRYYSGLNPNKHSYILSLVVSLFTMRLIPEEDKLYIFKNIYNKLGVDGAFIFSEEVFSLNSQNQTIMVSLHYDYNKEHFPEIEILGKVQERRHFVKNINEELLLKQLESVGFRSVQSFWRNFNFVGFIARKRP